MKFSSGNFAYLAITRSRGRF